MKLDTKEYVAGYVTGVLHYIDCVATLLPSFTRELCIKYYGQHDLNIDSLLTVWVKHFASELHFRWAEGIIRRKD